MQFWFRKPESLAYTSGSCWFSSDKLILTVIVWMVESPFKRPRTASKLFSDCIAFASHRNQEGKDERVWMVQRKPSPLKSILACVRVFGCGKALQRWASGEAIGVVSLAVVVTDLHAGGLRYWSLGVGLGDSNPVRQHLRRLSSPI